MDFSPIWRIPNPTPAKRVTPPWNVYITPAERVTRSGGPGYPLSRKIVSLHFDGLHIIRLSLDQIKNWSTKSVRQWPLLQTGTMSVESSVSLNRAGWLSMLISRSFIKILNKYGPLTLSCVVPLFTHFHCICYVRNSSVLFWNGPFCPKVFSWGN